MCVGSGGFRIDFLGDLMIAEESGSYDRSVMKKLGARPSVALDSYFDKVGWLWAGADEVVANYEGTLTTRRKPRKVDGRRKPWYHRSPAAVAGVLRRLNITAVGLANNHALDFGLPGLRDTLHSFRQARVATFGAGGGPKEAAQPLRVKTPGGVVAVLGFQHSDNPGTAGEETGGILRATKSEIAAAAAAARRSGARWLVAFVHWGSNYVKSVSKQQGRLARRFAAEGFSLVVGHGPHVVQPMRSISGTRVVYSLGNSVFSTPGRFWRSRALRPGIGWVLQTRWGEGGLEHISPRCILTDNFKVHLTPRLCPWDRGNLSFHDGRQEQREPTARRRRRSRARGQGAGRRRRRSIERNEV